MIRKTGKPRVSIVRTAGSGASVDRVETDRAVARRILRFLENRRVLCYGHAAQCPEATVTSASEIRDFLTYQLLSTDISDELTEIVGGMRKAAIDFIIRTKTAKWSQQFGLHPGSEECPLLDGAIQDLRRLFAQYLSKLTRQYELKVRGDLAGLLSATSVGG